MSMPVAGGTLAVSVFVFPSKRSFVSNFVSVGALSVVIYVGLKTLKNILTHFVNLLEPFNFMIY